MKAYTPHPEEPKDGEEVMGVTFKSCDLEDYDKLQSRIDDLKKKLENE
jgi:tetrahydromethanopterin S-methyltransferase subunit G